MPVIEVLVKPGDVVTVDQSLVTLESDKAAMDVPSPVAGKVTEVVAKVGDKVSMGTLIARVESAGRDKAEAAARQGRRAREGRARAGKGGAAPRSRAPAKAAVIDVTVPDIGDFTDVPVIEILVKAGDTVEAEQPIVTLESDKASMDVPSPAAGRITEIVVKVGDKVSMGALIAKARRRRIRKVRLARSGGRGGCGGRGGRRGSARYLARRPNGSAAQASEGRVGPGAP